MNVGGIIYLLFGHFLGPPAQFYFIFVGLFRIFSDKKRKMSFEDNIFGYNFL